MTTTTLQLSTPAPHLLLVTLNRPEVLNAINTRMGEELLALWTRLTAEPGELRCVLLTGAGERAFCAGGDLKERHGMTDATWRAQHEIFERAFFALLDMTVPVIAAVNGHAYGGGLETALACDFIYADANAKFALSETRLGIMPGGGGTQNLARAVGERRAKELILRAQTFSAEQAAAWGLVNHVSAPGPGAGRCAGGGHATSPPTARWRCARPRSPSTSGCRATCAPAAASRSRPTTGWCRRRTGTRACAPSTRNGRRQFKGQ